MEVRSKMLLQRYDTVVQFILLSFVQDFVFAVATDFTFNGIIGKCLMITWFWIFLGAKSKLDLGG